MASGSLFLAACCVAVLGCDNHAKDEIGRPMWAMTAMIRTAPSTDRELYYSFGLLSYTDVSEPNLTASLNVYRGSEDGTVFALRGALPPAEFSGWWEAFGKLAADGAPDGAVCRLDRETLRQCRGTQLEIDYLLDSHPYVFTRVRTVFDEDTNTEAVPALGYLQRALRYLWDHGEVPEWITPTVTKAELGYPL